MIRTFQGIQPRIPKSCFIEDTAVVIGDVVVGEDCSVWFHAVIRGDVRMTVETSPSGTAGGAVVTYVDVLAGTIDVIRYTVTPDATPVPYPAIRLGAHEGVTITGGTAGPIRPLRMVSPGPK